MTQAKMRLFGCPEHQRNPTRAFEAFKVERREKDEVYRCSWDCSWLYSMKLGLLRPHGIDVREVQESLEAAYHMKQYRQAKWMRIYQQSPGSEEQPDDQPGT